MGEAKNATCCGEMKYMMFKIEARNSRGRARVCVFIFSVAKLQFYRARDLFPAVRRRPSETL